MAHQHRKIKQEYSIKERTALSLNKNNLSRIKEILKNNPGKGWSVSSLVDECIELSIYDLEEWIRIEEERKREMVKTFKQNKSEETNSELTHTA